MNLTPLKRKNPALSTSLQLKFSQEMPREVFTGECIVAKGNGTLEVALVDGDPGDVVRYGAGASGTIEIVPLEENFDSSKENWSREDFNRKIVVGEDGRKSLLGRSQYLKLQQGTACVCGIKFNHTRKWMKNSTFRLGARFVDQPSDIRIREAISEPFIVKDRRGKPKKHYPPSLTDEVWRLQNIAKRGAFHRRLAKQNIQTVGDFLNEFRKDPKRLQEILVNMSNHMWKATSDHALTCQPNTNCEEVSNFDGDASCSSIDLTLPATAFCNSELQHVDKNNDALRNSNSQPDYHSQRQWGIFDLDALESELPQTIVTDDVSDAIASFNTLNPDFLLDLDKILKNFDDLEADEASEMINEYMQMDYGTSALDIHSPSLTYAAPISSMHDKMQHNQNINPFQSVTLENACQSCPSAGVTDNSLVIASIAKYGKGWAKMSCLVKWFLVRKAITFKKLHIAKQ